MKNLCAIRDLCAAIGEFEEAFQKRHTISMNEGMVLCSLKESRLSSGEIAKKVNLTCSNTSKLIRSIEDKGYIVRVLGEEDKRQMYFSLTQEGLDKMREIEEENVPLSGILKRLIK